LWLPVEGRYSESPRHITLLHVIAFLLGSAALTAFGRVQYSVSSALTSRYTTASVLFCVCLIALSIVHSGTNGNARMARHAAFRVAALLAAAVIGGLLQLPKVSYAIACERYLSEGEYAMINGAFEPSAWERFFQVSGGMIPVVRHLREQKLGSFSRPWTQWIGTPASTHFPVVRHASACSGAWQYSTGLSSSFRPSTLSEGWAYDWQAKRAPNQLVFVDKENRILGFTTSTRRRSDVLAFRSRPRRGQRLQHRLCHVSRDATYGSCRAAARAIAAICILH
jgi:hypothetical protein